MKAITPDLEYLSTRQSAKVLKVSLGTVQKMVELGELIAWKTRGATVASWLAHLINSSPAAKGLCAKKAPKTVLLWGYSEELKIAMN